MCVLSAYGFIQTRDGDHITYQVVYTAAVCRDNIIQQSIGFAIILPKHTRFSYQLRGEEALLLYV